MSPELTVRQAQDADAGAVAQLFLDVRAASVPAMPPQIHTPDEVRAHTAEVIRSHEVWLVSNTEPIGYLEIEPGWLHSLYVAPTHQGTGIGSMLLDLAKSRSAGGFELWVFVSNELARRFYARHGLVEVERTDGSENEERSPDIRLRWSPPAEPAAPSRAPPGQP